MPKKKTHLQARSTSRPRLLHDAREDFRLVLIVCGSIAAYKVPQLCRDLRARGFVLQVVATQNALRFVAKEALSQASGTEVACDMFEDDMRHIRLARWAEGVLIVPATANFLARLAFGLCDDLGSTLFAALERQVPVFAAPAMNPQMWQNPANLDNVALLQKRKMRLLGPCIGATACKEVGAGRMLEPSELATHMEDFRLHQRLQKSLLAGERVLITAGATREAIDSVRFLSNRSSGKQGFALAQAFSDCGAEVLLVAGASSIAPPVSERITTLHAESALDMAQLCRTACGTAGLEHGHDKAFAVAVCAAAVADFRVQQPSYGKPAKKETNRTLELAENPDILKELGALERGLRPRLVIGFAAETEALGSTRLEKKQRAKKKRKGCDWLLACDVSGNKVFGSEINRIQLLDDKDDFALWDSMSKYRLAMRLVGQAAAWLGKREQASQTSPAEQGTQSRSSPNKLATNKLAPNKLAPTLA